MTTNTEPRSGLLPPPAADTALPLAPGRWTLDASHSTVSFWIRHLGVSKVRGRFNRFDAVLDVSADGALSVTATIETASVDTGNEDRDAHLRTADFLDVVRWPGITFASTAITGEGERWTMAGDLTIAETTRPVSLPVELGGVDDFFGSAHAGFGAEVKIDRREFGLDWKLPPGAPSVAVGDVIHVELDLQLVAPATEAAPA
jgi:polyisoprenoid-binding protein YceI